MTVSSATDRSQLRLPGQAAAAPGPLNMDTMYLIHHALRRDFARLAAAARSTPLRDTRRLTGLRDHLEYVLHSLHQHHSGEDEVIWPELRRRAAAERALVDTMEAEHAGLDTTIAAARAAFTAFAAAPTEAARSTAADAVDALGAAVDAHLAHEERDAIPLLHRVFTHAEFDALEDRLRAAHASFRDLAALVPWMADGVPDDVLRRVWAEQPKILWLLYRRVWRPRYQRRIGPLFTA